MSVGMVPPALAPAPTGFKLLGYNCAGVASASVAVTTTAINTTGANLLVACITNNDPTGTAVFTDSASNTWTALTRAAGSGHGASQIFYVFNPVTSATHTLTIGAVANSDAAVTFMAFSGSASSPLTNQSTSLTANPGSITPANNGSLIVAVCNDDNSAGASIAAVNTFPWSNVGQLTSVAGNRFAYGTSIFVQNTAATINQSFSSGTFPSSAIAAFRSA